MTVTVDTTTKAAEGAVMRSFDPSSAADFRRVLGCVPTSVAVIASTVDDRPVGVAVGSFASVSLDPPLVGFFITDTSTTWPLIEPTGGFCASVLSASQPHVSRLFAQRGADKFAGCSWRTSASGRPIIDGSMAWMDCTVVDVLPAGDHRLVLGRVDHMGAADEADPLAFLGGAYGRFEPLVDPSGRASWD